MIGLRSRYRVFYRTLQARQNGRGLGGHVYRYIAFAIYTAEYNHAGKMRMKIKNMFGDWGLGDITKQAVAGVYCLRRVGATLRMNWHFNILWSMQALAKPVSA